MTSTERNRAAHLGPERRRPQVLDAALDIAVEQGIRRVTMDLVAKRMGVSKPVLYSCYASREEMLLALLAREEQRLFAGVMAALPAELDLANPKLMMISGFRALLHVAAEYRLSWQLVFAGNPDPDIAERYGQARRLVAQRVHALMRPGLAAWNVTDIDRKLPVLVELFMSMGDGAVRAQMHHSEDWNSADLGEFIGLLTYGALQKA